MGLVATLGTAKADVLTCQAFRDRLEGALMQASVADSNAEAPVYDQKRAMPDGGGRLTWKTSDLSGTLSCGTADSFREFYVSREVVPKDQLAAQVGHLITLDGASICSVLASSPVACNDAGKLLLQNAVEQVGTGLKRKMSNPSGLSHANFQGGITADLTAAPTLITFSLSAKEGGTIDATRQPLGRLIPDKPAP